MTTDHTLPGRGAIRDQLAARTRDYLAEQDAIVNEQVQLLTATWEAHTRGEATWDELYAVAAVMRESGIGGFATRWNEIVPVSWNRAQQYATRGGPPVPPPRRAPAEYLAGTWTLARTMRDGHAKKAGPARGTYVVYELLDDAGQVVYIGATVNLTSRLNGHREKPWRRCTAREARDQVDAEGLEAVAILTKRPPLNKQLTSWSGAPTLLAAAEKASVATPELRAVAHRLNREANARVMADEVEQFAADEGTTWSQLKAADPRTAEWFWTNTLASSSSPVDTERVEQILAERETAVSAGCVTR